MFQKATISTKASMYLRGNLSRPRFLSFHPGAQRNPLSIKDDEVSMRSWSKCTFPILNSQTPVIHRISKPHLIQWILLLRRIVSGTFYSFAKRTASEPREISDTFIHTNNTRKIIMSK